MSRFIIIHEVTDDTPDGIPWPPIDDYFWCAIKRDGGRTTWRRISIQTDGRVNGGLEDFDLHNLPPLPPPPRDSDDP